MNRSPATKYFNQLAGTSESFRYSSGTEQSTVENDFLTSSITRTAKLKRAII